MALMKCLECGKDVSDKATSCPNCGNPINWAVVQITNISGKNLKIEPELTSKTWKKVKLWGWGIIVASFFVGPLLSSNDPSQIGFVIIGIAFWGILILIIGHIGAWYADKRTR